jgi:lipid-A-disaccharide synthase
MTVQHHRIMVVAGEASGDKHAARLIGALRRLAPEHEWEVFGSGGAEMRAAGVETLVDIRELAIMGLLEVLRALPRFLRVFRQLRQAARERQPEAIILVDWPEFNLRLAKKLRRDGHRVFYYISPQIWAWRRYRIRTIRRHIEKMLVILPFEKEFYEKYGVDVEYVGHPLLDSVRVGSSRDEFCQKHNLDPGRKIIAFLPGSRHSEIRYILPPLLETITRLRDIHPDWQCVLPLARTLSRAEVASVEGLTIIENDTCNAIAAADLAVVASGTATLETAIIGTPLIVVYRASELNWRIFHPLIRVPWVGMPNLIAGRQIAPELLQSELNSGRLTAEITALLGDPARLAATREEMGRVRELLGEANASERAAMSIINKLGHP